MLSLELLGKVLESAPDAIVIVLGPKMGTLSARLASILGHLPFMHRGRYH